MIVLVIVGTPAVIVIPNAISLTDRAQEGATRQNLHTLLTAADHEAIRNSGSHPSSAVDVASNPSSNFDGPFDGFRGDGGSAEERTALGDDPTSESGTVSCADSSRNLHNITGSGQNGVLTVVLRSGQ